MNMRAILPILLLLAAALVTATDFVPSGNISGKGIYTIYNFTTITANSIVGLNSTRPGNCTNGTAVQNTTATGVQCVPLGSGNGSVTSVGTGTGLQGGPITNNGTISLNTTYTDARYLFLNGTLNWSKLLNFPAACAAGTAITELAISPTCTAFIQTESDPLWAGNASRVTNLESSNTTTNSRIDSLNTSMQALIANNASLNATLAEAISNISGINSTLNIAIGNISSINATAQGLLTSNTTTNSRIDSLNDTKLNLTDQRYNESARVDALNTSKADSGTCPNNYVVQNATATGVQCIIAEVGNASGTVYEINTSSGIQGGPITSTGTLSANLSYFDLFYKGINGSVSWTNLTSFPAACSAGNAVTEIGSSLVCSPFISSESDPYWSANESRVTALESANVSANSRIDSLNTTKANAGTCSAGQVVQNATSTGVQCVAASSGSVTAVTAGYGLNSTIITSTGTLNVNDSVLQNRLSGSCSYGIASVNQDGTVSCATQQGTLGSTENATINALVANNASLNATLNETIANLSSLNASVQALISNNASLNFTLTQAISNISGVNSTLNVAVTNISALNSSVQALIANNNSLNATLTQAIGNISSMNSTLNVAISNISGMNSTLDSVVVNLTSIGNWTADKSSYWTSAQINNATIVRKNSSAAIQNATLNASNITNAPWLTSFTESDPLWVGNASRVSNLETANISANSRIDSLNNSIQIIDGQLISLNATSNETISNLSSIGNWTADKPSYWTSTQIDNTTIVRKNSSEFISNANLSWANLSLFPAACSAGYLVQGVGTSLSCSLVNNGTLGSLENATINALVANNASLNTTLNEAIANISGVNSTLNIAIGNISALNSSIQALIANNKSLNSTLNEAIANISSLNSTKGNVSGTGTQNQYAYWVNSTFINSSSLMSFSGQQVSISGNLSITYNLTVDKIIFPGAGNHTIEDDAICIVIKGNSSVFNIC